MNKIQYLYEEELYTPPTETPAETRERPPTLDLPKCQCRCCGCVCVSSRGKENRVEVVYREADSMSINSTTSNDSDGRFDDRIASQEGVETHIEDLESAPWIEVLMSRLARFERPGSPDVDEPMDGSLAPPTSPETPGVGSPDSMYSSMYNSMYNEPKSGYASMPESVTLGIYEVLQSSGLLGSVGAVFEEQKYLFTADPLCLGHESQHCRNLVIGGDAPNRDEFALM